MAEAEGLDMTLDQMIQKRESKESQRFGARKSSSMGKRGTGRSSRGNGRWGGRRRGDGGGPGGSGNGRNSHLGVNTRARKVVRRPERWTGQRYQQHNEDGPPMWKARQYEALEGSAKWKHDMFDASDDRPVRRMNTFGKQQPETAKILISNLDYNVSDEDIQELFMSVGPVKKAAIDYERSGRSKGTAEVVYERRTDAEEAIKRFNDVCLDGKPLVMQLCKTSGSGDRSYITTLSSGISVTDPKTTKRMETSYYQAGFDSVQQSGRQAYGRASRLRSAVVPAGLYSDRMVE